MDKQVMDILQQLLEGQKSMQGRLEKIESAQEEHGQILRAIDERTQVHSAEIANLQHEVAEVKGDIKRVQKDIAMVEEVTANNWSDIARMKKSNIV